MKRVSCALVALGVLMSSIPAQAQDIAVAETLYERGVEYMNEGRLPIACRAFAESHRIDPRIGTLFTLAMCEFRADKIATASARFADYLSQFERLPEEKRAAQGPRAQIAADTRAQIQPDIPYLTIKLPSDAPKTTVVRRNGEEVTDIMLGLALPVDPGEYVLTTSAPGVRVWEIKVVMAKGEKKDLVLKVNGPERPVALLPVKPSAPKEEGWSASKKAGLVLGSLGIGGLIAGGVLGMLTMKQRDIMEANCGAAIGAKDEYGCARPGLEAKDKADRLGTGSTVAFGVGGLAAGMGAVLFFSASSGAKKRQAGAMNWTMGLSF